MIEEKSSLVFEKNEKYQSVEKYLYEIESHFIYQSIEAKHRILFYTKNFSINSDTIPYSKIFKVSKHKEGLQILTIEKELLDIPCKQYVKRKIFNFLKFLNEKAKDADLKTIIGTAVINFYGQCFIIHMRSPSYEDFKSIVLKRIAFHVHLKDRNQIILEHFEKFKFFIKDENINISLENSSDFTSALFHYNNRLVVHIKYQKE